MSVSRENSYLYCWLKRACFPVVSLLGCDVWEGILCLHLQGIAASSLLVMSLILSSGSWWPPEISQEMVPPRPAFFFLFLMFCSVFLGSFSALFLISSALVIFSVPFFFSLPLALVAIALFH